MESEVTKLIFVYPKFGLVDLFYFRLFGPGLGNTLFPWARSIIISKKYGYKLIAPTWLNIKIGTLLRGERDSRAYANLFNNPADSITGFTRLYLLCTAKKVSEYDDIETSCQSKKIIACQGMHSLFKDILDEHEYVYKKLISITRHQHLNGLKFDFSNSITIHARLGDFKTGKLNTEISWFVSIINILRSKISNSLTVYIFSDGSNDDLLPLLKLPNVHRVFFGSSIADLLALSRSNILVGSKNSTFSMWASYLGRMPVIWPERTLNGRRLYGSRSTNIEIESNGKEIPSSFIECYLLLTSNKARLSS